MGRKTSYNHDHTKPNDLEHQWKHEAILHEKLLEENRELEKQFESYQKSLPMRVARKMKKVKYYIRQILKIITGKRNYKDVFSKPYKKQKAKKRIKQLTYRLYELGFEDKAVKELETVIERSDNQYLVELAQWELVSWYANKGTVKDLQKAMMYLTQLTKMPSGIIPKRKMVLMESEIYAGLGMKELAVNKLDERMKKETHVDLFFGMANLKENISDKVNVINEALSMNGQMSIDVGTDNDGDETTVYDRLRVMLDEKSDHERQLEDKKISIIIPAYNSESNLSTAIESLLHQTWRNIEIIVVDDCSTDQTFEVAKAYTKRDSRVTCYQNVVNSGPYIARNKGLNVANGDYITVHDADDWSHPEKIAYQANHLSTHPEVIANTSLQARVTEELTFFRRGKPGVYAFPNMSSLMFKAEKVREQIGYWDSVRFGADAEFKKRMIRVFGKGAVTDLKDGIYSFQRQTANSLTGSSKFGYHGFFMGARKEHREAYLTYHESGASLTYPFPMKSRPFPVPVPMKPDGKPQKGERRHFDVIIASEFRLLGGTNMSNIEEIKAQKREGLRTGLIQLSRYDLNSVERVNSNVRDVIDGDLVQMLVYGEEVSCDVLIVRHPPALQEWQKYVPDVKANKVEVIVNQPPKRDYSETGETLYYIKDCLQNLKTYFGQSGTWYPIGPEIRKALEQHHKDDLAAINLAREDWVNIIDVEEWKRDEYIPKQDVIRVGRHSRDQYVKWPETREQMEKVYPSTSPYEIHVLGGANSAKKVMGELPKNWHVKQFGEQSPQDFLKDLDVFVYYTHSGWVEAFGRVIFEAMAAGVPVIIEPKYKDLFGEAAIYAEADNVQETIDKLMNDPTMYKGQVDKALAYVESNFGYSKHIARIAGNGNG
ncbi:glycosyltransferase [Salipaludibacillus daqingensis]|uniref:glycosyltransferase n=1 Tax=Salipaludibacillus daqingensis TaxID=3041001 RepID=UPI002477203A|nr:glycosyltransferase [Salipaludibacillus daqingensis]